jgi:glycosyltransferase involved in cell wall biosynthesis
MMKHNKILYIGNNLLSSTKYATSMDILSDLLSAERIHVVKSSSKKNKLFRMLDMCISVYSYRKKIDYVLIDVFSTSNFYYAFATSFLSRLLRLKYIPILHGGNLPFRLDKSPKMSKIIFNHSYYNISPSGYLKHEFEKRKYKVTLIPNVVEVGNYTYKDRVELQPKLLYVRALDKTYNPEMAIEVLSELKVNYPDAKLCMIGPDKDGSLENVRELAIAKEVIDDVEFTGVLTKKAWHKRSEEFDIFINTTNIDNTPISVIEAMALGLPIVSTSVGGLPYLIKDLVDGLLIDKGNVNQMVAAIESLLNGNHNTIAKNARKKAEQFVWSNVKSKWLKILQ